MKIRWELHSNHWAPCRGGSQKWLSHLVETYYPVKLDHSPKISGWKYVFLLKPPPNPVGLLLDDVILKYPKCFQSIDASGINPNKEQKKNNSIGRVIKIWSHKIWDINIIIFFIWNMKSESKNSYHGIPWSIPCIVYFLPTMCFLFR